MTRGPARHTWAQPVYNRSESLPTVSHNPEGLVQNSFDLVLNRRSKHKDDPPIEPAGDITAVSLYNRLGQRYFECGQVADAIHCLVRAAEFCGNSHTAPRQILLAKTRLNIARVCLGVGETTAARQQAERARDDLLAITRTLDDLRCSSQTEATKFLEEEAVMTLCFSWHALALASSGDATPDEAMGYYNKALEYCEGHLGSDHSCYGSLLTARDVFAQEYAAKSAAKADIENASRISADVSKSADFKSTSDNTTCKGESGASETPHWTDPYTMEVGLQRQSGVQRPCSAPAGARELGRDNSKSCGSAPKSRGQFHSFMKKRGPSEERVSVFGGDIMQRPDLNLLRSHEAKQGLGCKPHISTDLATMRKAVKAQMAAKSNARSSNVGLLSPPSGRAHQERQNPFEEFIQERANATFKMTMASYMASETHVRDSVDVLRQQSAKWRIQTREAEEEDRVLPGVRPALSGPPSSKGSIAKLQKLLQKVEKSHKDLCKANPDSMMEFINSSEQTHGDDDHMVNSFKEVMKIAEREDKSAQATSFFREETARFFRERFTKLRLAEREKEQSVNRSTVIFESNKALAAEQAAKRAAEEDAKAARENESREQNRKKRWSMTSPKASPAGTPARRNPDGRRSMISAEIQVGAPKRSHSITTGSQAAASPLERTPPRKFNSFAVAREKMEAAKS